MKEQARLQAEQERSRILQRLRDARAARTKPHEPRWFTLHPEVRSRTGAFLHYLLISSCGTQFVQRVLHHTKLANIDRRVLCQYQAHFPCYMSQFEWAM